MLSSAEPPPDLPEAALLLQLLPGVCSSSSWGAQSLSVENIMGKLGAQNQLSAPGMHQERVGKLSVAEDGCSMPASCHHISGLF